MLWENFNFFLDEEEERVVEEKSEKVTSNVHGKNKKLLQIKRDASDREIRLFISSPFR